MSEQQRAEPAGNIENRLQEVRMARGLSQAQLAANAGITRQAVYSIEANQYLPTTAVALRLAGALHCRVEDLFNLVARGEEVEGELFHGAVLSDPDGMAERLKVAQIGDRIVARPAADLGETLRAIVPADGVLVQGQVLSTRRRKRGAPVTVRLWREWTAIQQSIWVAGCDPAIYLAGEYLRRRQGQASVIGWLAGSGAAVDALRRGEVHVAGVHLIDHKTGEANLPYLRRHVKGEDLTVVTFASWEQGWIVRPGNPSSLRHAGDLAKKSLRLVNREPGAGARQLLDHLITKAGLQANQIKGYEQVVPSHLAVARSVAEKLADVGVGTRSAASAFGLEFLPLRAERYDLVMFTRVLRAHPALAALLDTIVTRAFRAEMESLGGYDTSETGKVQLLRAG